MSNTMKAIIMTEKGGPEVLRLSEIDRPEIKNTNDVLIRVRAAGVNPADWQMRKAGTPDYVKKSPGPWILGLDGAGVVEAVGDAVTLVSVGDEVYYTDGGFAQYQGSYAEYKVVDEQYLALKPKSLGFLEAAALPVVVVTTFAAVFDQADVKSGDFVLVHGGAGGLGHIGIQLALSRGARVATTVSTDKKAGLVKALGAEYVIRYRDEDVKSVLSAWSGKEGADVVFDFVGHENFAASFDLVAPYGTLVNTVESDWPKGSNVLAEFKNMSIKFVNMGWPQVMRNHAGRLHQTQMLKDAAQMVDDGKLKPILDRVYPLTQAGEAQWVLEAGETVGRVVLEI
jgi:NADPH:quinone reductase